MVLEAFSPKGTERRVQSGGLVLQFRSAEAPSCKSGGGSTREKAKTRARVESRNEPPPSPLNLLPQMSQIESEQDMRSSET